MMSSLCSSLHHNTHADCLHLIHSKKQVLTNIPSGLFLILQIHINWTPRRPGPGLKPAPRLTVEELYILQSVRTAEDIKSDLIRLMTQNGRFAVDFF